MKKTDSLPILYQEMADLTRPKCGQCRVPLSCCDPLYCEMAEDWARDHYGVELEPTGHDRLKFMGQGGCVVPPHMRPLCTLHLCSINSMGFDKDPAFNVAYFKLRSKIEVAEWAADKKQAIEKEKT